MSTKRAEKTTCVAEQSLWRIAETDDPHELESILASGVDINASNAHGMTALMRAAAYGRIRMVRVLLKRGADPNLSRNDKFTPLLLAAFFGHEEIVRILVAHGADTGAATRFGTSARMWAASRTFADVAHYLENSCNRQSHTETPASSSSSNVELATQLNAEPDLSLKAPAVALESVAEKRSISESGSFRVATAVETKNVMPEPQEKLDEVPSSIRPISRLQPFSTRTILHATVVLALVLTVSAGLSLRHKLQFIGATSTAHPTVSAAGVELGSTRSQPDDIDSKATLPVDEHHNSAGSSDDLTNHYKTMEIVNKEDKSTYRPVMSITDSGRTKPAKRQNPTTVADQPRPILAGISGDVTNRQVPQAPASTADSQPASIKTRPASRPAPLTTQLISPSTNSPPKGKVIQWP